MIDIRRLKELVRLMVSNDLTELDLRDSEEQVTLRRYGPNQPPHLTPAAGASPPGAAAPAPQASAPPATESASATAAEAAALGLLKIASPMVGTFYAAANPDAKPFVTAGSTVEEETVVCMLEAMKIFNEIKAECSGTVEKVLVNNGDSVDFGQPLFLVRPA